MIKISYLVSTYDSGAYLDQHIEHLIHGQTDPNFEIIIVNPCSPGTDDIIAQKWQEQDIRVKYLYWPQREWYGESWIRAWTNASGEFVMNSNTDDFHEPVTTEMVYKHMKLTRSLYPNQEIAFCYGGMTVIDERGKILGKGLKPPFDFDIMSRECWAGPQVAWRNDEFFRKSLDWNLMQDRAREYRSAFDYWLWLYFMSLGYHGHTINAFLTVYTQRPDSIENRNKWENNWETYSAISEFFPHHFNNNLKHAKEFKDFFNRPPRQEWVEIMQRGKKWKS